MGVEDMKIPSTLFVFWLFFIKTATPQDRNVAK